MGPRGDRVNDVYEALLVAVDKKYASHPYLALAGRTMLVIAMYAADEGTAPPGTELWLQHQAFQLEKGLEVEDADG
jgi:hypothetical protein